MWFRRARRHSRWIVLDVETTGLDVRRDRLLAIAATALRLEGGRAEIDLADSFEIVLRHEAPVADAANILLHGIGVGAQRAGAAPGDALRRFVDWVADAPLLGFHVGFDRAVLERHLALEGLPVPAWQWLDIEPLAGVLRPDVRGRALDDWMAALDVRCAVRHRAASDVLATCELLLKLWPRLHGADAAVAAGDIRAAQRLAAQRRWLPP